MTKSTNALKTICDLYGRVITIFDLPQSGKSRWRPNEKVIVLRAVDAGMLSLEEVLDRYELSLDEYISWKVGLEVHGVDGLKVTKLTAHRAATMEQSAH